MCGSPVRHSHLTKRFYTCSFAADLLPEEVEFVISQDLAGYGFVFLG